MVAHSLGFLIAFFRSHPKQRTFFANSCSTNFAVFHRTRKKTCRYRCPTVSTAFWCLIFNWFSWGFSRLLGSFFGDWHFWIFVCLGILFLFQELKTFSYDRSARLKTTSLFCLSTVNWNSFAIFRRFYIRNSHGLANTLIW
jgi:hypothetical protein